MGVKNIQTCDMCGIERDLKGMQASDEGWKQIPIYANFEGARQDQPWLCRECRDRVARFIDSDGLVDPKPIDANLTVLVGELEYEVSVLDSFYSGRGPVPSRICVEFVPKEQP